MHHTIKFTALALVASTVLAGCANRGGGSQPIVDRRNVDPVQYQRDLAECQSYAGEVQTGRNVGGSAVTGAVVGGAIGAIVGNHNTAERMAGVGAVTGSARGVALTVREKRAVLRNCLNGRGYRVLN